MLQQHKLGARLVLRNIEGALSLQVCSSERRCGWVQVILAAGDTFRAAAAEQLSEWATRSGATLVSSQKEKARPDNVLWTAVDQVSLAAPSTPSGDCNQQH